MAINRKPGFYWVYEVYPTGWIVAQYLGNGTWIIPGWECTCCEDDFDQIDERQTFRSPN
jgi:hypothetical protein